MEVLGVLTIRLLAVLCNFSSKISLLIFFNNFLILKCMIYRNFTVKFSVRELPKCLLFIKVGAPNDYRTAFIGCFDYNIFGFYVLRLLSACHSSLDRLETLRVLPN